MSKLVQSLLSAALVMFAAAAPLATPAHAKFEFGATESIRKIQDVDIKGSEGEALFLGYKITRQAITKHLRVLADSGLVRGVRRGRENLFQLRPKPLEEASAALRTISQQWDDALARLKAYVAT